MFKLLAILSLFLAIQGQPGSYFDRPDLIQSPATQSMVKLALDSVEKSQNVRLTLVDVVKVSFQVVSGYNYHITFTARASSSGFQLLCTAIVYQDFGGSQSVTQAYCA